MIILLAGFITTRLESIMSYDPSTATFSEPSTVFYLRGMGNWRGFVETMGELMMNDVDEGFSPHFFTAYGIYRWSSFQAVVTHRANWLLPELDDPLRLVDKRMFNLDDPKSVEGVGLKGEIFPLSWAGYLLESIPQDAFSVKVSALYGLNYHNRDFYGWGMSLSLPVRFTFFSIEPGYAYFEVNLNNLGEKNSGREFFLKESYEPWSVELSQAYAESSYPSLPVGRAFYAGFSRSLSKDDLNATVRIAFHSVGDNFRAVLRSSDVLSVGVPFMYLSESSPGTGFSLGIDFVFRGTSMKMTLVMFDLSSLKYLYFSRVRISPFGFLSLRGVFLRSSSAEKSSVFFGEASLRITRRLKFVANYKKTFDSERIYENFYTALDFSIYKWARLLVGYGDNGDPESEYYLNDVLPGIVSESTVPLYFVMMLLDF